MENLSRGSQAASPIEPTTSYYLTNQVGSTMEMLSSGGWPVSQDTIFPYGMEPSPPASPNSHKFAGMKRDQESELDHTPFRQYAAQMGRWMTPDPYNGSYDLANPQTFNRYVYAVNNPLGFVDPTGLVKCQNDESGTCWLVGSKPWESASDGNGGTLYWNPITQEWGSDYGAGSPIDSGGPAWTGPVGGAPIWGDPYLGGYGNTGGGDIGGGSGSGSTGTSGASNNTYNGTWYRIPVVPHTNYCGPGGYGPTLTRVDADCKQHDACYANAGASWANNVFGTGGAAKQAAIQACNAQLCSSLQSTLYDWPTSQEAGQATLVGAAFGCMP